MEDLALKSPPSENHAASVSNLLGWLFRERWFLGTEVSGKSEVGREKTGLSAWAVALILTVAALWSTVASAGLLGWDPHYYFSVLEDGSWKEVYPFEPTMFLIVGAFHSSFASYIFAVTAIHLGILLIAFHRLKYSRSDQLILIFFFTCSFYGLHFMVTFQRQFCAVVFFILAAAGGRGSLLCRVASIFSHLYALSLHVFWELRRLPARVAVVGVLLTIPILMSFSQHIDSSAHYGSYGEENPLHLILKQALTVGFSIVVLMTLERGDSALRSITAAYIACSLPVAFWPSYAGIFVRFDYFFFPVIVAFWPRFVREERRLLCRLSILGFTVLGFVLWITLNSSCLVMGICAS